MAVPLTVGIVAIIGGVLLGLLVTIGKLISAFGEVAHVEAAARSQLLSEGISSAMLHGFVYGGSVTFVGVALVVFGMLRRSERGSRRGRAA